MRIRWSIYCVCSVCVCVCVCVCTGRLVVYTILHIQYVWEVFTYCCPSKQAMYLEECPFVEEYPFFWCSLFRIHKLYMYTFSNLFLILSCHADCWAKGDTDIPRWWASSPNASSYSNCVQTPNVEWPSTTVWCISLSPLSTMAETEY